jgi:YD repeat-containing protein
VADDGRCYELDEGGRLLLRRTRTGKPVFFSYDKQDRLIGVANSSGQAVTIMYDPADQVRVRTIAVVGAEPAYEVTYDYAAASPTLLTHVCYGLDGNGACVEDYTYGHGGGTSQLLLMTVEHGGVLEEAHLYEDGGNRVRESRTPTDWLQFIYDGVDRQRDCPTLNAGLTGVAMITKVVDLAEPPDQDPQHPWATACLAWDKAGRLLESTSPAGCTGDTRQYGWAVFAEAAGTTRPLSERRMVGQGTGSTLALSTRTYHPDTRRLASVVENDLDASAPPPPTSPPTVTTAYEYYPITQDPNQSLKRVTRTPGALGAATTTELINDKWGNLHLQIQQGTTCNADTDTTFGSCATAYRVVTRTDYVDGSNQPSKIWGTYDEAAPPSGPHTVFEYYDEAAGPRLTHRLRRVLRRPSPSVSFVERVYEDYDVFGRPTKVQDANLGETLTEYDPFGRVTKLTSPSGAITITTYDRAGRVQTVIHPEQNVDHYAYRQDGEFERLVAITRAAQVGSGSAVPGGSERTEYGYDRHGNVTSERSFSDPQPGQLGTGTQDRSTGRVYRRGHLTEVWSDDPARSPTLVTTNTYEPDSGALLARTDWGDPPQTTTYTYDWGRLKTLNGATAYDYTADGALKTVIESLTVGFQSVTRVSSFTNDDLGRLVQSSNPNSGLTRQDYAPDGSLRARIDADGRRLEYGFDRLGRIASEAPGPPGTAPSVVYEYGDADVLLDALPAHTVGRLARVRQGYDLTTFAYDPDGRIALDSRRYEGHPARETRYDYGPNGNLRRMQYPDGVRRLEHLPDPRDPDLVQTVTRGDGAGTKTLARDATWYSGGRLRGLRYGNGAVLERVFQADGRPASITARFDGTPPAGAFPTLFHLTLGTDALGRPTDAVRVGPDATVSLESYQYDDRGRLTLGQWAPGLRLGYGAAYNMVKYRYGVPNAGNRTDREFYVGGSLARSEQYWYTSGPEPNMTTDRLYWMKDPVAEGGDDCPSTAGAAGTGGGSDGGATPGGGDDHGCRDHGAGLGCHDAGPEQRQRDAGARGGAKDGKGNGHDNGNGQGNGNGEGHANGQGNGGQSAPADGGQPIAADAGARSDGGTCAGRPRPQPHRGDLQQDYLALLADIRAALQEPAGHWDRSYNRIGGMIARFLGRHHVTPRTFLRALLSQGQVRDDFMRLFDRSDWNGPRPDQQQPVIQLLNDAAVIDMGATIAAFEGTVADDVCYTYDHAGNVISDGYKEPYPTADQPSTACANHTVVVKCAAGDPNPECAKGQRAVDPQYRDLFCYRYDAWNRLVAVGMLKTPRNITSEQPCANTENVVTLFSYRYDWKGRRVSSVLHGLWWLSGVETNFFYDTSDRLVAEIASSPAAGTVDVPLRNYYFLGGELLAQERLADEELAVQGGPSCVVCAVGGTGAVARGALLLLGLGLAPFFATLAMRARRRGERFRARHLGMLALGWLALAVVGVSCVRFTPLQSPSVYYYHNDFLGTPQRMSDDKGAIVWTGRYEPFGQIELNSEDVTSPLRLPGQYDDHTRLPFGQGCTTTWRGTTTQRSGGTLRSTRSTTQPRRSWRRTPTRATTRCSSRTRADYSPRRTDPDASAGNWRS